MLPAQIVEQLIGRDRQIPNAALEEVPGECRLRRHYQLRRFGPASDLPEKSPNPAEILLVRALLGPHLGYGETEHALKVRGERLLRLTSQLLTYAVCQPHFRPCAASPTPVRYFPTSSAEGSPMRLISGHSRMREDPLCW